MNDLDRFFIKFSTRVGYRWFMLVLVLALAGVTTSLWVAVAGGTLILAGHALGIRTVARWHPAFEDDLTETMAEAALESCEIHAGEHHYLFREYDGCVEAWGLRNLPGELILTVLAPKRDSVVIAKRRGKIFPPRWLAPLEFDHQDLGSVEVFYSDVDYVELTGRTMTMHTSGGHEVSFGDQGEAAGEAVLYLRQRLREHKSR